MTTPWKYPVVSFFLIALAPAAQGADLKVPNCQGLLGWAKTYHPSKVTEIAPRVNLDNIFAADASRPVFGKPALEWNAGEIRAVGSALANCSRAYRKQRNRDAAQALNTARSALGRSLRGAINYLARTEQNLDSLRNGLLRRPARPDTYRALAAYDTAEKVKQRHRNLASVPDARIREVVAEAVKYRAKIRGDALAKAGEEIKALPASSRSLIAINGKLDALKADFDDTPERKDFAALEALAEERRKAIVAELTAASGGKPPMVFPQCDAFYKWAAATNTARPVRVANGTLYDSMFDEKLAPVFGRQLDAWTDDDLAAFREGMQACEQALARNRQHLQSAGRQHAYVIAGALPAGRRALGSFKKSRAALTGLRQRVAEAKPTMEGIQELTRIRQDPALAGLPHQERRLFDQSVRMRQQKIAAGLMEDSVKGLAQFKTGYDDLQKIAAYRDRVMSQVGRLAAAGDVERFEAAFRKRDAEIAAAALPDFKKKLGKLPVHPESIKVAKQVVNDLVGPRTRSYVARRGARRPAQGLRQAGLPGYLAPYRDAAQARVGEIEARLHAEKCKKTLAGVSLSSSQARMEVLGPLGPTTMGDVVCRMVMTGHKFHSLKSPGMFGGKDHVMKVTLEPGGYQTVILRSGEIGPGKKALVGYSVADANRTQTLTVQQWQGFAAMLTGQTMEAGMKMLEGVFRNMDRQMRQQTPRR